MKFLLICLIFSFVFAKFDDNFVNSGSDEILCAGIDWYQEQGSPNIYFGLCYDSTPSVVGFLRGQEDSGNTGVMSGTWVKDSEIFGSFELTNNAGDDGFTGTWWFGESSAEGKKFEIVMAQTQFQKAVIANPSIPLRGNDVYSLISGNYSSTEGYTFYLNVQESTGLAVGYIHAGLLGAYVAGRVFYNNGPIFSGRYYTNNALSLQNEGVVIPLDYAMVIQLPGMQAVTFTQQSTFVPEESEVLPPLAGKYSTQWTGRFDDAEETSWMMNINGHMYGTYYSSGKVRGSFNGPVSDDGMSVSGYWYSPSSQLSEEMYGRMTLTFDQNYHMTGIWNFGEEEPNPANHWIVGSLGYQTKAAVFTSPLKAQAFDEEDGYSISNSAYYAPGNESTVNAPVYICKSGDEYTESWGDELGFSTGNLFQKDHISVGYYYEEDGSVGVNHYLKYYGGYLNVFYFPLDEAWNEKKDEAEFLGLYMEMGSAGTPTDPQCTANEILKVERPSSARAISFSLLSLFVLAFVLF